ncbi:MAG: heme exporter protein CcmD [Albidovulum sp.]|nr:heme exporter protein CcmD [Albidovulum sp.]
MFAELGQYQFEVLAAYGATILLIGGIVALSAASSAAALRKLNELRSLEKRNE